MVNTKLVKSDVENITSSIIQEVTGIIIEDTDVCLFDLQYRVSAEDFVYILLKIRKEFSVDINDAFVESMKNYTFNNLVESIIRQSSKNIANI